jgi:hypothetical protein
MVVEKQVVGVMVVIHLKGHNKVREHQIKVEDNLGQMDMLLYP